MVSKGENTSKKRKFQSDEFTTAITSLAINLGSLASFLNDNRTLNPLASKKAKNANKDPNAPKQNLSSYLHFSREQRPLLEKKNLNLTPNETVSEVAKKWRALSEKEKQKYVEIAKADKIRYDDELKVYKSNMVSSDIEESFIPSTAASAASISEKKAVVPPPRRSILSGRRAIEKRSIVPTPSTSNKKEIVSKKKNIKVEPILINDSEDESEDEEDDEIEDKKHEKNDKDDDDDDDDDDNGENSSKNDDDSDELELGASDSSD